MTDFFDIVTRQRACRDFAPDDVPDADIERILEAATHAPSAENKQPWLFVVVRDAETRHAISDLARKIWDGGAREMARISGRLSTEVDDGVQRGFGGAPVLIVVSADTTTGVHPKTLGSSIYPATQNLLLAANALGYGSALTTLTTVVADELRAIVSLPESVIPMAVAPIGRPARPLGLPKRRPVADVAHRDRFGTRW